MVLSDGDFQRLRLQVVDEFLRVLDSERPRIRGIVQDMEASEHREQLAKDDPIAARILERHTLEERLNRGKDLATALAVAHAIEYGFALYRRAFGLTR